MMMIVLKCSFCGCSDRTKESDECFANLIIHKRNFCSGTSFRLQINELVRRNFKRGGQRSVLLPGRCHPFESFRFGIIYMLS